jgi:hypothetical protein
MTLIIAFLMRSLNFELHKKLNLELKNANYQEIKQLLEIQLQVVKFFRFYQDMSKMQKVDLF